MLSIDYSFDSPGRNLALDEVLLKHAAQENIEILRFWESPIPFVVLGLTQKLQAEVNVEHCDEDHVCIQRRCSAGGCVVQGPGCLNYTLVLSKELRPEIQSIQGSYQYIFDKLIKELNLDGFAQKGVSDLAFGELKVSGNAQRRQKDYILHHGTLLYDADLPLFSRYIHEPEDRPEYRGDRDHRSFIRNLPLNRLELLHSICRALGADRPDENLDRALLQKTQQLADEKYDTYDWIHRK